MLMGSEKYVVKKGRHFLLGFPWADGDVIQMRYTPSPWDGWKTKKFDEALRIAKLIGGKVMKFNQVTGCVSGGWK